MPEAGAAAVLLAFGMVTVGAILQMTTGVGLGLIAGPFMLFVMDPAAAIQTAIVLNLLLSLTLLPWEWHSVELTPLAHLIGWAIVGIPLGSLFLISVDGGTLKLVSGAVVLAAALQLSLVRSTECARGRHGKALGFGGFVSGVMTGALAIPGPVALWALLSSGLDPRATRATLRAFFVVAYGFAYVVNLFLAGPDAVSQWASLDLSMAVVAGMIIGGLMRRHVSPARLGWLLELLLFVMGASLIIKGVGFLG